MNPKLLHHYRQELQFVREMGAEFAEQYPKIAGRLGLESLECSDPYVERLLEGFAFSAARVQLKIDASGDKLARHLLEMLYPDYLAPIPSMVVARFTPNASEGNLADGFTIERGTMMKSLTTPDVKTPCHYSSAHDVQLWPIELGRVSVLNNVAAIEATGERAHRDARWGVTLELKTTQELPFSALSLDRLPLYLSGVDGIGARLFEQLHLHTVSIGSKSLDVAAENAPELCRFGFDDDQALLPVREQSFQGYRLLQEYFSFPQRFQFVELKHLDFSVRKCDGRSLELIFQFDNERGDLGEDFKVENFELFCTPAINLFKKKADRIHLDEFQHEYHVLADRTRPMDFEIYALQSVKGYGRSGTTQAFHPYFSIDERRRQQSAFYGIHREPRLLSSKQQRLGARASYVGSEVYLALVDGDNAPFDNELKQLSIELLCTNRDLPLLMPVAKLDTDFVLESGAPVDAIRCVAGPTVPRASRAHSRDAWQLVSNLSLNYLSISDASDKSGDKAAAMMRQMLELYTEGKDRKSYRQVEGIVAITCEKVMRQLRTNTHYEIVHGRQIRLLVDEAAFEGIGAYLFGSVMENFFSAYASINSFTETVLESQQRGEIARWSARAGSRQSL